MTFSRGLLTVLELLAKNVFEKADFFLSKEKPKTNKFLLTLIVVERCSIKQGGCPFEPTAHAKPLTISTEAR